MKSTIAIVSLFVLFGVMPLLSQEDKDYIKALSDYTANAKATNYALTGKLTAGLYVVPEGNSPATLFSTPKVTDLGAKINWRLSATTLREYSPGAIACFDAPTSKRPWTAVVLFQDLEASNYKSVEKQVANKFSSGTKSFYVIYSDPSEKQKTNVFKCSSDAGFRETWQKTTPLSQKYRYILTENMAWVAKVPPDAEKRRQQLIKQYVSECKPLVAHLIKKPDASGLTATIYKQKTDNLFEELNSSVIIDDKLKSYELHWRGSRNRIGPESAYSIESDIKEFHRNLIDAAKNTKCTVNVFTSNGQNAEIHVAKRDRKFKVLGLSIVTIELERASYYFQAWRNGKLTGETAKPIDCTGKKKNITIIEN